MGLMPRLIGAAAAAALACPLVVAPAQAALGQAQRVDLVLVRQDFDVRDTVFTAKIAIDPVLEPGVSPESVTVVVTAYERVTDPFQFDAVADGRLGNALDSVDLALPALTDDGSRLVTVPLEIGEDTAPALQLRRPGLYPVVFDVRVDGDSVADLQTFVHRLPVEADDPHDIGAVMQVSMVASITSPPALGPDGVTIDATALESLERLADLVAVTDAPLTVALPPEMLMALADQEPALVERLARNLDDDELLSVPYVPFDPSSAVTISTDTIAGSEVFARLLIAGEEALSDTISAATVRTSWIGGDAEITQTGAAMLRNLGVRLLVISRDRYDASEGNIRDFTDPTLHTRTRLPDGSTLPTAVIDRSFSERLTATGAHTEAAAVSYAADLVAWQAMFAAQDPPNRIHTMTLAMPDLGVPDPVFAGRVLELLRATPTVEPVTLSTAAASTAPMIKPEPVVLEVPTTGGPDISHRMQLVSDVALKALSTSSMLPSGDPRTLAWDELIERLPSTALPDDQADATVAKLEAEFAAIQSAIQPPEPFSFTLSGNHSTVPLRFENHGDEPLTIMLRLSSPKLRFPNHDQIEVLEPGVNEVSVEVDALSNGKAPVSLDVRTPAGGPLLAEPIPLTANVNALTGLAQVVTLGALGLLATWWVHHLRGARRRRANGEAKGRHPTANEAAASTANAVPPTG